MAKRNDAVTIDDDTDMTVRGSQAPVHIDKDEAALTISEPKEEDDPTMDDLDGVELNSRRFILAKFLGAENHNSSIWQQRAGNIVAKFVTNEWMICYAFIVTNARGTAGNLDWKKGRGNHMVAIANHPNFETREIPPQYNTNANIHAWAEMQAKKGRHYKFAHSQFMEDTNAKV